MPHLQENSGVRRLISPMIGHMLEKDYIRNYDAPVGDSQKTVLLPFNATGVNQKSYYFNPDHMLDGKNSVIRAIELVDVVTNIKTLNYPQRDMLPLSVLTYGILNIIDDKRAQIAQIPLTNLVVNAAWGNNGKRFMTNFDTQVWNSCYVEFTNASSISSSVGMQFIIHFSPNPNPVKQF